MRYAPTAAALLAALTLAACGPSARYPGPGTPAPVPYADTLPIQEPEERSYEENTHLLRSVLQDQVGHTFSVSRGISGQSEALNVGAFDGVAPSAWFEHRITGPGGMTPEAVAEGPPRSGPDTTGTLTVIEAKVGGVTPGFTVRDRRDDVFLVKFDPPGNPGLSSGSDVVSSLIFWAAGYHVPKDVVFALNPGLLEVGEEAEVETDDGVRPMRPDDVIRILERTDPLPDQRFRALASRFVSGTPKGPFRFTGTRNDDPNDRYPHEDRRELRGLWVLAAWVGHVDLRFQNTLDVWIEPTGYLRHYFIDFGATLGSRSIRVANPREGREYAFDLWPVLGRWASLGLYRVGWEDEPGNPIRPSLGWIATMSFDPGGWKPFWPNDAYRSMTDRDGYWGAKLVAAFDEDHVRAAIREARYPDPAAADSLMGILQHRRRAILEHWYGRVTPVEEVAVEVAAAAPGRASGGGDRSTGTWATLRFRDLGLRDGIWLSAETRYRWRIVSGGEGSGDALAEPAADQAIPVRLPPDREAREGPVVLELTAVRPDARERPARIRLVPDGEDGGWRVTGLIH